MRIGPLIANEDRDLGITLESDADRRDASGRSLWRSRYPLLTLQRQSGALQ
jgi:hypothetical protein